MTFDERVLIDEHRELPCAGHERTADYVHKSRYLLRTFSRRLKPYRLKFWISLCRGLSGCIRNWFANRAEAIEVAGHRIHGIIFECVYGQLLDLILKNFAPPK